jgi:hypothetical protein
MKGEDYDAFIAAARWTTRSRNTSMKGKIPKMESG